MIFDPPCVEAKILKRYKRFLADIELPSGMIETAHCPNTGSMATCYEVGGKILVSHANNPNRKLRWTWELSKTELGYVGVNTTRPNKLVLEAIKNRKIENLCDYKTIQTEVKYGEENSRIDILLSDPGKCFLEVKNATLFDQHRNSVLFPDAITKRGQKHLHELIREVHKGNRAIIFFVVNRPEGVTFSIAKHIDPEYAKLMAQALSAGVEVLAWRTESNEFEIKLVEEVPVQIDF